MLKIKNDKVYVDELPSCCEDCVCHNGVNGRCKLLHRTTFDIPPRDCPLQTIADHDKQVRKQVCSEIRQEFEKHTFYWYEDEENVNKELYLDSDWVWEVLDQIEKENSMKFRKFKEIEKGYSIEADNWFISLILTRWNKKIVKKLVKKGLLPKDKEISVQCRLVIDIDCG